MPPNTITTLRSHPEMQLSFAFILFPSQTNYLFIHGINPINDQFDRNKYPNPSNSTADYMCSHETRTLGRCSAGWRYGFVGNLRETGVDRGSAEGYKRCVSSWSVGRFLCCGQRFDLSHAPVTVVG